LQEKKKRKDVPHVKRELSKTNIRQIGVSENYSPRKEYRVQHEVTGGGVCTEKGKNWKINGPLKDRYSPAGIKKTKG